VEFSDGERRDLMLSVKRTRRAAENRSARNQVCVRFEPTQLRMKLNNGLQLVPDLQGGNDAASKSWFAAVVCEFLLFPR
jgi:hypothetical protein